jgi:uncharacterized protein with PQ loop repeat
MAVYALFLTLVTAVLYQSTIYELVLGYFSGAVEMILGLPQFLLNLKRKNTYGLSKILIGLWTVGDVIKFIYYMQNDAPTALCVCQLFSVAIDCAIIVQFFVYKSRKNRPTYKQ